MTDTPPPPRTFLQIRLSTALVMMLIIAAVLCLNLCRYGEEVVDWGQREMAEMPAVSLEEARAQFSKPMKPDMYPAYPGPYLKFKAYGWPSIFLQDVTHVIPGRTDWEVVTYTAYSWRDFRWSELSFDFLVALGLVLVTALPAEYLIRRRSKT
jgi:hypothetical protein